MTLKRLGAAAVGLTLAVGFLTIVFTATHYATDWFFTALGITPQPIVQQLAASILGLIVIVLMAGAMMLVNRGRLETMQLRLLGPIVEALGKIAQGDYTVRLNHPELRGRGVEPVGILVNSVNTLAQELDQMEAMRQEFISNVSHEIQSPLTSIRGFARALHAENLTATERAHYLNIIETESVRLSKLTENLLALASLDSESYTPDPKPYRLDLQVRDVVLACEPQWQEKQIEMDVATEPTTLTADKDLLNQVWINLVHNAIKFTPPQGKIQIELHHVASDAEFCITDNGIGISEADQTRIFERFYKADPSRERARGGSGLGLAICKKIVDLHHGTIQVTSKVGHGSTFAVRLPVETK